MPEIYAKLDEHNIFLDNFFAKNKFLASGLLEDKSGGIILVMSDSIEEAQSIMQKDPFYIHDLVDFEYTFFAATKLSSSLSQK
jgi:Uncharacterized protein conserved in bacteria